MMATVMNYPVEERQGWRRWVTPRPLEDKPVHRWYVFPHSFTSELVHALIDEWGLGPEDSLLDPFAGAGTTLLAAKEKGIPACGYDLSPLAVLVTRTKIANYELSRLLAAWTALRGSLETVSWKGFQRDYPELIRRALPGKLLSVFDTIDKCISELPYLEEERDFFRTALLAIVSQYSQAIATGGWLKWVHRSSDAATVPSALAAQVEAMLGDLCKFNMPQRSLWNVHQADARRLPDQPSAYSTVITSPPYPNRHDYTRVFGVELMLCFLSWEETRKLRYQSFHSHPEARPERFETSGYTRPEGLTQVLTRIEEASRDPRIPRMLEGYFLDMFICLREVRRVCRPGARIAFVVGNVQYYGEPVLVDELTAEVGEQAGLTCEKILAVRYRGNSAQQMGSYGRNPSRESVVVFRRT